MQYVVAAAIEEARESARVSVQEMAAAVAQRCEAEEQRRQEAAARAQVLVMILNDTLNPTPETPNRKPSTLNPQPEIHTLRP